MSWRSTASSRYLTHWLCLSSSHSCLRCFSQRRTSTPRACPPKIMPVSGFHLPERGSWRRRSRNCGKRCAPLLRWLLTALSWDPYWGCKRFQLRGDAFNVFNAHHFNNVGTFIQSGGSGGSAFNTDVASPDFGKWNGGVSSPRNIQVSGRISF